MILEDARSAIVEELKRRLHLSFPTTMLYEGSGSVWGEWARSLPCIHIFEQVAESSASDTSNRGVYRTRLPIQLEFVSKLQNRNALFTEGRSKLIDLRKAVELDRRFVQNKGLDTQGSELAVYYLMTANELVEAIPGVIDVAVIYDFVYIEKFFG